MASRRQYLTQTELSQYADITITNAAEADDQITQAEEMVDAFVGFQDRAVGEEYKGRVSSASANTFGLELQRQANTFQGNYFIYCEVEIFAGTGTGQRRTITGSTYAGIVTISSNWDTNPDTTSYYRIYQLGKFPRCQDEYFDGLVVPQIYTRSIPEAVRRAVAAQVEYMINMGPGFFASDSTMKQMERIGDYMYNKGTGLLSGSTELIAPKAKQLLKGIINRKGVMTVGS